MDSNRFTEMGPQLLAERPPEEAWHQALSGAVSVDAAITLAGRFGHDCNIFSMIATDDTRPMPYTPWGVVTFEKMTKPEAVGTLVLTNTPQ
jgi:hypothetical protein